MPHFELVDEQDWTLEQALHEIGNARGAVEQRMQPRPTHDSSSGSSGDQLALEYIPRRDHSKVYKTVLKGKGEGER